MRIESDGWSGEGTFTAVLLEALKGIDTIEFLRVEEAPASRAEPGYAFISNEIYVRFKIVSRTETRTRLGVLLADQGRRHADDPRGVGHRLGRADGVGEPDYQDDGLLQFLRTERIVAPYQTKGVKVVELVRMYEVGTPRRE